MTCRIIVKQTPMGAFHFQLIHIKTSEAIMTSKDFDTRDQAFTALSEIIHVWKDALEDVRDLTPEGRRENGR